jgi:hypothetical protein
MLFGMNSDDRPFHLSSGLVLCPGGGRVLFAASLCQSMLQSGKYVADKPKIDAARNTTMVIISQLRIDSHFPSFERSASLHLLTDSQTNTHFLLTIFCNTFLPQLEKFYR